MESVQLGILRTQSDNLCVLDYVLLITWFVISFLCFSVSIYSFLSSLELLDYFL
jgi:hypothetical protein